VTYSVVARDPATGSLGVAVQSHFFSVGSLVTWAETGVGAVATQSFADPGYGPLALDLLREGATAREALDRLVSADAVPEVRQVAVVDGRGETAAHTGSGCVAEAGHRAASGVSVQANMMERATVCDAMIEAYEGAGGPFVGRLMAALDAAEAEGGDIRGRQSAAILVVGPQRSERPWEGVQLNLRVDDHPEPLAELRRLVEYHGAYAALGVALFQPGRVIGEYALDDAGLEAALADLDGAQHVLGDNPEPTFWRGVLLGKAGRAEEARAAFRRAAQARPQLIEFAARLPAAGLADAAVVQGLGQVDGAARADAAP
jgi:uncharacterized Ntn-hydrolase superfamily protein